MNSVLVVDDEVGLRTLMTRWVQSIGYSAVAASTAEQALDVMGSEPAAVAVCDIRMPGHDGLWLADQLRRRYPDTAVIMATGLRELDPAVTSLRAGAVDYLVKPFGRDQLKQAVERGLEWHQAMTATRNWRRRLEEELRLRQANLADAIAELEVTSVSTLDAMLSMLTARDATARDHANRVARLSVSLALVLGVTEPTLSDIERAALLHDIGRIAMPEALLCKPAELTRDEREVMHEHPQVGFDLLKNIPFLQGPADFVLGSREWFNGYGYPFGLTGAGIPLGSRVISVAETFDVLTHPQIYRAAISTIDAVQEICRCSQTQFDPAVVEALLKVVGEQTLH